MNFKIFDECRRKDIGCYTAPLVIKQKNRYFNRSLKYKAAMPLTITYRAKFCLHLNNAKQQG